MKHLKSPIQLLVFSSLILFSRLSFAQSDYEKRQKANKENEVQLKRVYENNLPNKPSGTSSVAPIPSSTSGSSIYVTEHQRKMEYYNNKENARLAAWEEKERRFRVLSADVPKTEANYYKLIALAEQAGFENYDAVRMNGRYAPKNVKLPTLLPHQQEQFDKYKHLAAENREKKDWKGVINAYLEALKISGDLRMRSQLAFVYTSYMQDYESAANQYHLIHQSPVTEKPGLEYNYNDWGEVSILCGHYEKAIWCFTDLPARYYENSGVSITHSYAYYLSGNFSKAHTILLNTYPYDIHIEASNLIKNYFLLQKGSHDSAVALFKKNKAKDADLQYTGDTKKDLALMLLKRTKSKLNDVDLTICYFLDLAADLDPGNMEITETRYDYNTKIKRVGFEGGMAPELLTKLAVGKPNREAKRTEEAIALEKLRNKGYIILWFGKDNKPLHYVGYRVDMAGGVGEQKVVDELTKRAKERETSQNYSYLNHTFLKDGNVEDFYNEVAKKLKLKVKKAKEYRTGFLYEELQTYKK